MNIFKLTCIITTLVGTFSLATASQTTAHSMVGVPNPIHEYTSQNKAIASLKFTPDLLQVVPVGYSFYKATTISSNTLQIFFSLDYDKSKYITYRVNESTEDISGDYNQYPYVKESVMHRQPITLKGIDRNHIQLVTWVQNGQSHSLHFDEPVTTKIVYSMIYSIRK